MIISAYHFSLPDFCISAMDSLQAQFTQIIPALGLNVSSVLSVQRREMFKMT